MNYKILITANNSYKIATDYEINKFICNFGILYAIDRNCINVKLRRPQIYNEDCARILKNNKSSISKINIKDIQYTKKLIYNNLHKFSLLSEYMCDEGQKFLILLLLFSEANYVVCDDLNEDEFFNNKNIEIILYKYSDCSYIEISESFAPTKRVIKDYDFNNNIYKTTVNYQENNREIDLCYRKLYFRKNKSRTKLYNKVNKFYWEDKKKYAEFWSDKNV